MKSRIHQKKGSSRRHQRHDEPSPPSEESDKQKRRFWKMLGNAILLASIQASIGSVEMSSKFSVVNFSKDQETLQGAADALTGYLFIAFIWTMGSAMISYGQFSSAGLITSILTNMVLVGWIYFSYLHSFRVAKNKYGLKFPKVWPQKWSIGL